MSKIARAADSIFVLSAEYASERAWAESPEARSANDWYDNPGYTTEHILSGWHPDPATGDFHDRSSCLGLIKADRGGPQMIRSYGVDAAGKPVYGHVAMGDDGIYLGQIHGPLGEAIRRIDSGDRSHLTRVERGSVPEKNLSTRLSGAAHRWLKLTGSPMAKHYEDDFAGRYKEPW